jgi:hypothetical protein
MSDGADRIRELSALPVWAAPKAGGPSTPGLLAAAAGAAAAGDPDGMSLDAGQGFRAASDRPAAEVIDELMAGVPR